MVRRSLPLGVGAMVGAGLGWALERRLASRWVPRPDPHWHELDDQEPGETHRITSFDGTGLHADVLGPDEAPTIVFAHAYLLSRHAWGYQRRALADRFRVVTYDQRGHGDSDQAATGDYSMHALGQDLDAVLDALVPTGERALLVGHSLGAMTVLAWAEQCPDVARRAAGAVLMATAAGDLLTGVLGPAPGALVNAVAAAAPRAAAIERRAVQQPSDLSALLIRCLSVGPDAADGHVDFVERLVLSCPATVRAALLPALTSLVLDEGVSALAVPTLVVAGTEDRLTPPWQLRRLAGALPEGRLVELAGIGHTIPLEAHEVLNAHLRRFACEVLAPEEEVA